MFEFFLLDQRTSSDVIALARRGADTAIEHIPVDGELQNLATYGRSLGDVLTGNTPRPTKAELNQYGERLFQFLFRGSLKALYDRLPAGPVSLQILSDRREVKDVPWEFFATPDRKPVPHRERSIIRVQPTCGIYSREPRGFGKALRILFVSADPPRETGVPWSDMVEVIERAFAAHRPERVSITIVPGATRQALLQALQKEKFDVFHFYGHGEISAGVGHLVLQDVATGKRDLVSAADVATALAGKNIQLAILSACLSGAGNQADDFGVVATALILAGVPAVVANQYPIPIKAISPFVGSLYSSLLLDGDIDLAVADGRSTLSVELATTTGGDAVIEWGVPILFRLPDAQQLFQP